MGFSKKHALALDRIPNLVPFIPKEHSPLIELIKDGSFHTSSLALSLYCTAYSKKSIHTPNEAPYGYIFSDLNTSFGVAFFKRHDGKKFLCIIPFEFDFDGIKEFMEKTISDLSLDGGYVRFLNLDRYIGFLNKGFIPAKESPWSFDSPEEDESLNSAIINAKDFYDGNFKIKYVRALYNRAMNFLERNSIEFNLVPLLGNEEVGFQIVHHQFNELKKSGKNVTSSPEDHRGLFSEPILSLKSVHAYLGVFTQSGKDFPVSVFVSDDVSKNVAAVYLGVSFRDQSVLEEKFQIKDISGFSALSSFTYAESFRKLIIEGFETLDLGGSEHASLNQWKRYMGAKHNPTYWAFLPKRQ